MPITKKIHFRRAAAEIAAPLRQSTARGGRILSFEQHSLCALRGYQGNRCIV
jgi:hypothetical protein